ncbi:hypothetical protein [Nonomuraea insulae]|uniref:Uncharacterized protein n=1 Tax=Nonomuraea insulae TaxID=1616787 RepID=A0ABW1CMB5_9ACTN
MSNSTALVLEIVEFDGLTGDLNACGVVATDLCYTCWCLHDGDGDGRRPR